jgi:glutamate/tyrosine decarboxylase-like PLP-dependent enzyme
MPSTTELPPVVDSLAHYSERKSTEPHPSASLDPAHWPDLRRQAHIMLDDMLDYVENIRERPVWQPAPQATRARFSSRLPSEPTDLACVHNEFLSHILPYTVGNAHPGFMGWVHGGGTPVGMLAEMLAAGMNANAGGRNQIPVEVERQITRWMCELFNFPASASGLFVTGTSMANFIAVLVARDAALGHTTRRTGIANHSQKLTAYASREVHGCISRALDFAGIGSDQLRLIPCDNRRRMSLPALSRAIAADRASGCTPFLVVGTAGTVNTGAIDDLAGIADLCQSENQREKLWFHVDGAYGALAMLAPELASRLGGIERADSLAFDFHKWGQVPYDAGFILVRDGELHRQAFASPAAYLSRETRGLAAGSPWPCDFGPDLSRGFRALKTWFTFKTYGTAAMGAAIAHTCKLARYLESCIESTPELELMAPVELNIVCFRYRAPGRIEDSNQLNRELVIELQESGLIAPSATTLDERTVIRAAIVNHRTNHAEIDTLVHETLRLGHRLQGDYA